jgi:hypothetical protein
MSLFGDIMLSLHEFYAMVSKLQSLYGDGRFIGLERRTYPLNREGFIQCPPRQSFLIYRAVKSYRDLAEFKALASPQSVFHLGVPLIELIGCGEASFQGNVRNLGSAGELMDEVILPTLFIFKDFGSHFQAGAFDKGSLGDIPDLDMELEGGERVNSLRCLRVASSAYWHYHSLPSKSGISPLFQARATPHHIGGAIPPFSRRYHWPPPVSAAFGHFAVDLGNLLRPLAAVFMLHLQYVL